MKFLIAATDGDKSLLALAIERARAIFILDDKGVVAADDAVCSGEIAAELDGQICEHSDGGRIKRAIRLDAADPLYSLDKGKPGDLCPPCALSNLSSLGHWQSGESRTYPEDLLELPPFKCRKGFWLVVPGLTDRQDQRGA